MHISNIVILLTSIMYVCLGTFVLWKNSSNSVNRRFCLFSYTLAAWAFLVFIVPQTEDTALSVLMVRLVFCVAIFIPATLFFFTSIFPDQVKRPTDRYLSILFFAVSTLLAFSSPYIVESVHFEKQLPHVKYGPPFLVFWFYFITCTVYSLYHLYEKSLPCYGIKKLQIQYLYFGVGVAVFLGAATNFILPMVGVWQFESLVPLVTIPFPASVAYAIVKYHLLDIQLVIKRGAVYSALTVALSAIYFTVGLVLGSVLPIAEHKETVTAIVSTIVMVLVFVPTREVIQHILDTTLFETQYSPPKILSDSTTIFSAIHDLDGLLQYAVESLYGPVGIETICILLKNEVTKHFNSRVAINFSPRNNLCLHPDNAVITWLCQQRTVLSVEHLNRFAQSKLDKIVADTFESLGVEVCVPVFKENDLFGIILLGKKVNKKPFTQEDFNMFLAFSGQLAMAISNAHLYKGLEEAKVYRDDILQSLRNGVLVVGSDEKVTLINNEAQRILGEKSTDLNVEMFKHICEAAVQLLRYTLRHGKEFQNVECLIERGSTKIPCEVTTIRLKTDTSENLGAVMIMTDLTELKMLQAEKRHSDRLASIGALAANIAHEIKNPLVAVSTYFQLLPHKRGDEEFQGNFQSIAEKELRRINNIIEEMLHLARPYTPALRSLDPHYIIRSTISLLTETAKEKDVQITTNFVGEVSPLIADEEQMRRVLINLLHNSLDAVENSGHINISTSTRNDLSEFRRISLLRPGTVFFSFAPFSIYNKHEEKYFIIKVSDTGTGIPAKTMQHLFEPFFTTKGKGTGLGLAIIYGILKEHKGGIYVESTEGKGTDFYVCLPLAHIDSGVSTEAAVVTSST
ncbi:MAG: hypothetical protein A2Y08_00970 [Planctomycetes bacterium GWA2_40_7]|nr:MAG: hypothetical protein A2Y08_00970 [Planctomycetes bacterium GWA2_40_7]